MDIERTNTILYCHHWMETVSFYRNTFAFPVSHQTGWFVEFQLTSHAYLSIADESCASIQSVGGQGVTLSWQVPNLQEIYSAFRLQNISVAAIQKKWGAYLFYLHDPEGHRIELWQPIETSFASQVS
jgi:catechol 2,3-dioxygenase-like lactoylglutathione lyase family enzyme